MADFTAEDNDLRQEMIFAISPIWLGWIPCYNDK